MSSANPHSLRLLGFRQTLTRSSPHRPATISSAAANRPRLQLRGIEFSSCRCISRRPFFLIRAIDEDSSAVPIFVEERNGASVIYGVSDAEEEKNAGAIYPSEDTDLPTSKDSSKRNEASSELRAWKFLSSQGGRRRRRIRQGVIINIVLIICLATFLLLFDWCSWRIIRQPLGPFYLTHPFLLSAALSASAGWFYVPIVDSMNIHQILRKEGPTMHYIKKGTPTMGGLFFIPIGIAVARGVAGQSSAQLYGATVATLAFAAIGLFDDLLSCMKGHNHGLPGWIKLMLQVTIGTWFSFWLESTNVTTPYNMYSLS